MPLKRRPMSQKQTVLLVALLNVTYFVVEFAAAVSIASVSLFADSIDFLEDASVNLLIFAALGWTARRRAQVGMLLALILLIPSLAALWTAFEKLWNLTPPEPSTLSLVGIGALVVNATCALLLARHRHMSGSLMKAAFLSARNDVLANIAIMAAGPVTLWTASALPDLLVGLGILVMNGDAAVKVYKTAYREARETKV